MSPILGIYASQISGHLVTNNYSSISTVTVGSTAVSSISFTGIPSTYTHLQIRGIALANSISGVKMSFNGDTGTNYAYHDLSGNGSAAHASGVSSVGAPYIYSFAGAVQTTYPMAFIIDVLDYANVNKYKTSRILAGNDTNNTNSYAGIEFNSTLWQNTNAITSINIANDNQTFTQYSSFALYGVK
jgi:hypothetical protein